MKRQIALKLGIIVRQMRKAFETSAGELGVTRSQWMLIAVVVRNPGATQRTIARALEMSEASAGRLIDRLCDEGLLERRAKSEDRRAHSIYVTEHSRPLLEKLERISREFEEKSFAGVSDDELAQAAEVLDKIYHNIGGPHLTKEPPA